MYTSKAVTPRCTSSGTSSGRSPAPSASWTDPFFLCLQTARKPVKGSRRKDVSNSIKSTASSSRAAAPSPRRCPSPPRMPRMPRAAWSPSRCRVWCSTRQPIAMRLVTIPSRVHILRKRENDNLTNAVVF